MLQGQFEQVSAESCHGARCVARGALFFISALETTPTERVSRIQSPEILTMYLILVSQVRRAVADSTTSMPSPLSFCYCVTSIRFSSGVTTVCLGSSKESESGIPGLAQDVGMIKFLLLVVQLYIRESWQDSQPAEGLCSPSSR